MYAITGATGNTGSVIADKLLARGEKVRVIGRNRSRLDPFVKRGAEPVVADATDAGAMTKAFAGAKAVYLMIPPNLAAPDATGYQERVSDALSAAAERAGVENAVLLSSIGADKKDGTGPVLGLHNFEEKLSRISKLKALYLRAGYFMENLLPQVGVIKSFGIVGGPVRGDLRLPMIASHDIGSHVAAMLLALTFDGRRARELQGQRDVSYDEVAAIVGNAIGRPGLRYSQLPPEQLKPAFAQMGMSASVADGLLEMADAMNSGHMVALEPRSPENTTATSIEKFTELEFVPRFNAREASA